MTELVGVPEAAHTVFGDAVVLAEKYHHILATRGVEWGLIGPRETERLWERHILNSVAVSQGIPRHQFVVDVGSGAGLPGIPLALARPDLTITLLEPLLRRATFLEQVVAELGLDDRVRVVRARAEDHREHYDVVTSRAVAALPKLLTWTTHLFYPGGRMVALKGESAAEELAKATKDLQRRKLRGRVKTVQVYPGAEPTRLMIVQ